MRNRIDLRLEMSEWIRDYGIKVLYQRSSKYIKCHCVDKLYKVGDNNCSVCNGTGKKIKIDKTNILMQEMYPISKNFRPVQYSFGNVYNTTTTFYFEYDNPPRINDIIYIVGWKGNIPMTVNRVYEIINATPVRGDTGRIEFYIVEADLKPEMIKDGKVCVDLFRRIK